MKKLVPAFLIALAAIAVTACTDTERAGYAAYGEKHKIVHLTNDGDTLAIYESTGVPHNEEQSDGYKFMDNKSNKLVRISGGIVVITPE